MSTLWAVPGCSQQLWLLLWSLHLLPGSAAAEGEACRGGESHLEPTGLVGWQGEGGVWQGSSRGWEGQETLSLCAWVSMTSLFRFVCREVREVVTALGSQLVLVVGSDSSCQLGELSLVPLHCGANREMSPCWHAGLLRL